jgi:RNA polymerase sigma factor (sigma-70 family)
LTEALVSFRVKESEASLQYDRDVEMRTNRANEDEATLIVAAQAGDRRATEELLSAHLPLVYTIVRRAMNGDPDVDDVVQETMLRALRDLPKLLNPGSFRAWLAAIAVRRISTHQHRGRLRAMRTADLEELTEAAEAEPGFEEITVFQLELAGQRRQLVRARSWLDPKDQTLLSLWLLETAGQLTRSELAEALGVGLAHATVRIQRMRAQLDVSRALVAAVEARPRCADLDVLLSSWDGRPSSPWRKRIARHTRTCPVCRPRAEHLMAPESLLAAFTLLPVPMALAAGVLGKVALDGGATVAAGATLGGAKAGLASQVFQAVAAHPVTLMMVTGSVITGTAVVTANWPDDRATPPVVIAVPSTAPDAPRPTGSTPRPSATALASAVPSPAVSAGRPTRTPAGVTDPPALTLAPGPASLESVSEPGRYVATTQTLGELSQAGPSSSRPIRAQASFEVVAGLADPACFSFRLDNGQFLRHSSWRLRTFANDGSALFRGDATFCPGAGSAPGSITLESSNYPGWFMHHRGNQLWVDQANGTDAFLTDSSFYVRSALSS